MLGFIAVLPFFPPKKTGFDLLWGQDANVQTWRINDAFEMARSVHQSNFWDFYGNLASGKLS